MTALSCKQTENMHNRGKKSQIFLEKRTVLTTKLLLTFSKMRFSFSAIASPFLFFTRFFSSFLQAYIFPVARTWQAQTWRKQAARKRDDMNKLALMRD